MENIGIMSPEPKRHCYMSTPESMKMPSTSTPKSCVRGLNFGNDLEFSSFIYEERGELLVMNVPEPFMERTLTKFLEKFRLKNQIATNYKDTILRCYRNGKAVVVEFRSKKIVDDLLHVKEARFLNTTVQFKSAMSFHELCDIELPAGIDVCRSAESEIETEGEGQEDKDVYDMDTFVDDNEPRGLDEKVASIVIDDQTEDPNSMNSSFVGLEEKNKQSNDIPTFQDFRSSSFVHFETKNVQCDIPTCQVTVKDLPKGFSTDNVIYEFHKALWRRTKLSRPSKPILSCDCAGETEAVVTFDSDDAAATAAGLVYIEYEDFNAYVEQIKVSGAQETPSCKVRVLDLPEGFSNENVIYEFQKAIWKRTTIKKPVKPIVCCDSVGVSEAVVMFDSVETATIAAGLLTIEYLDCNVGVEQIFIPKNTPSCKVRVWGLPNGFSTENITYELHKALWRKEKFKKPCKPIVCCQSIGESEAVVTLDSVHSATLAELKFIEYDDDLVNVEQILECNSDKNQVPPKLKSPLKMSAAKSLHVPLLPSVNPVDSVDDSEEENENNLLLKDSCFVKVSNVPTMSKKDDFIKFLHEKMIDANFINVGEECVVECFDKNQRQISTETINSSSVVVKFNNCENANLACLLEDVILSSCKLTFVKYCNDPENNVIEGLQNESNISVNGKEGTLIFTRMLIKLREDFPTSGSHDIVLEKIRKMLLKKGVCASIADLRNKRRTMLEQYRKRLRSGNTDHESFNPSAVIFDGANESLVKGTKYDPDAVEGHPSVTTVEKTTEGGELLLFSNTTSWSIKGEKALVELLIENSEDYHKRHTIKSFWTQISNLMLEKKFPYTAKQCNDKDADLRKVYKDYLDEFEHTGAAGPLLSIPHQPTRELMQRIGELLKGSVSVEPKVTVAVGFKAQEKYSSEKASSSQNIPRVGKSRPTVLKRNKSLAERRVEAMEKKADALSKIAGRFSPKEEEEEDDVLGDD